MENNWDTYGAERIKLENVINAARVLSCKMDERTPLPSIVPTCNGGVQAEWHCEGIDLELEFDHSAGDSACVSYHESGKYVEGKLDDIEDEIIKALSRMRS